MENDVNLPPLILVSSNWQINHNWWYIGAFMHYFYSEKQVSGFSASRQKARTYKYKWDSRIGYIITWTNYKSPSVEKKILIAIYALFSIFFSFEVNLFICCSTFCVSHNKIFQYFKGFIFFVNLCIVLILTRKVTTHTYAESPSDFSSFEYIVNL